MQSSLAVLKEYVRRAFAQIPFLWRAFLLVWDTGRAWTVAWILLLILQGLLPVANVYLTRMLINLLVVLVAGPSKDWAALRPVVLTAALMALVLLVNEILRSAARIIRIAQSERVKDYVSGLIHAQSTRIDLAFYESPDYYDQMYRARVDASHRPVALMENIGSLFQNSITLGAMAVVLVPFGWWLPLALLLSTLPALYVVLSHRLRQYRWNRKNTEAQRRAWYYDWLLAARETAAELRLFDLGSHYREAFQSVRRCLVSEQLRLVRDQGLSEFAAGLGALLISGAAVLWMAWQVLLGVYTLGDLGMFYQAFNQGQSLLRTLLENAGEIYSNSMFLGDLFDFLNLEPQVVDPPAPLPVPQVLQAGIRFEGVDFSYPGGEHLALHSFNLSLPAGQVAAVVGANGAGKSTLIKLLCRFYDPQAGAIYLDDIDLRQFSVLELRQRITVLFQEPVHYSATVQENIALGDLHAAPGLEAVQTAARAAGADGPLERLPDGYDTLLGKWFKGGMDLSVGEWQRVALARAFLRRAPLILLDEPTSAMDPWAEADWLGRFRSLAKGHTALLITHRFTTAAYADRIYVMDKGQIVEAGTHRELLETGGAYAQSWKEQMQRWVQPV